MRSEKISAYQPRDRSKGRPRHGNTARVRSSSGMTGRIRAHGRKPAPRRWVDLHPQRAQPRTASWSAIILSGNLCGEPYLVTLLPGANPCVTVRHPGLKFL